MKQFTRQIRLTEDGSKTIYIPELDENYHSTHGALQEAQHVFITHGLHSFPNQPLSVLEIGFGTGLNALLTAIEALNRQLISYTGLEAYPVEADLLKEMDYTGVIPHPRTAELYQAMHELPFGKSGALHANFELLKVEEKLEVYEPDTSSFDLIYFDAFGPRAQEDMWAQVHFAKLFRALKPGGIMVTYCAKGQVKRDLKAVGFVLEALPGPPGKREMTRAHKPQFEQEV
jgi:tRNA U34 5-methylaminomethyl-2-thiouridine-forming methyltransferase MnmC